MFDGNGTVLPMEEKWPGLNEFVATGHVMDHCVGGLCEIG